MGQRPNPLADAGRVGAGLLLMLLLSSCASSRFEKDWKAALQSPHAEDSIAGPWKGVWISEKSGHGGALRALIEPSEDHRYPTRFHATYRKFFEFSYPLVLETTASDEGRKRFVGIADLGWLGGGTYYYKGHMTPDRLYTTYRARNDHGYFVLSRPEVQGEAQAAEE